MEIMEIEHSFDKRYPLNAFKANSKCSFRKLNSHCGIVVVCILSLGILLDDIIHERTERRSFTVQDTEAGKYDESGCLSYMFRS